MTDDPTRRDLLGFAGLGAATLAAGGSLLAGALTAPEPVDPEVPPDTIRVGREGEGTRIVLSVDKRYYLDHERAPVAEAWWLRVVLVPWNGGDGIGRSLWLRKGTCIEVERQAGRYAAIEAILARRRSGEVRPSLSGGKRVRLQIPTGGTGPPPHRSGDGDGPSSIRTEPEGRADRRPEQSSPLERIDASDQLSFGLILQELAGRFEGSVPAVAGEGVLSADLEGGERVPVDEDVACTRRARD